jgi:hypothetical protein
VLCKESVMPIRDNGCHSGGKLASRDAHTHVRTSRTCKGRSAIRAPVGRAMKPVCYTSRWRGLAKIFAEPASLGPRNRFVVDVILDFPPRAGT